MYLYHYYEKSKGPFLSLSALPFDRAQELFKCIRIKNSGFAAKRPEGYLERRLELEKTARELFIKKGGKPEKHTPHYMVVDECEWLKTWYRDSSYVKIDIGEFDINTISFSYGDMFPTFSPHVSDGREYRRQIYTYDEILKLIEKYGLPQAWNADGSLGPERYIEAHVWSDSTVDKYRGLGERTI